MESDGLSNFIELFKSAGALPTAGTIAVIFAILAVFRDAPKIVLLPLLGTALLSLVLLLAGKFETYRNVCADQPALRLSEVCAVGDECGKHGDFVELYNPSDTTADLACYGFLDRRNVENRAHGNQPHPLHHRVPGEQLAPKAIKAWGRDELGFGLDKDGDDLELVRLSWSGQKLVCQQSIDQVPSIDADGVYWYRPDPNTLAWEKRPLADESAIASLVTFDAPNAARSARGAQP